MSAAPTSIRTIASAQRVRRLAVALGYVLVMLFVEGTFGLLVAAVALALFSIGRYTSRLLWPAAVTCFVVAAIAGAVRSRSPSVTSLAAASHHLYAHDVAAFGLGLLVLAAAGELTEPPTQDGPNEPVERPPSARGSRIRAWLLDLARSDVPTGSSEGEGSAATGPEDA